MSTINQPNVLVVAAAHMYFKKFVKSQIAGRNPIHATLSVIDSRPELTPENCSVYVDYTCVTPVTCDLVIELRKRGFVFITRDTADIFEDSELMRYLRMQLNDALQRLEISEYKDKAIRNAASIQARVEYLARLEGVNA